MGRFFDWLSVRIWPVAVLGGGVLCSTAAVQAQPAPSWEGYWTANAGWCANAGESGDETPTWYGRDGIFGIEWSCDIRDIRETGMPNSWSVTTDCLDAGFAYSKTQIFLVTFEDRLLILDDSGVTANLVRCEKGSD